MKRPKILVNVAMSVDGKIDSTLRRGMSISSSPDKARVDRLRAGMDAVLIGGRTLLDDDPRLTIKSLALRAERKANGQTENPAKVGIVSQADLRLDGDFLTSGPARRLIYTSRKTPRIQIENLGKAGAEVFVVGNERVDVSSVMESLFDLGIRKVLVEGGGAIIAEFFRLNLVDELMLYVAPLIIAGENAPTPADGPGFGTDQFPLLHLETVDEFDEDGGVFLHYLVEHQQ